MGMIIALIDCPLCSLIDDFIKKGWMSYVDYDKYWVHLRLAHKVDMEIVRSHQIEA